MAVPRSTDNWFYALTTVTYILFRRILQQDLGVDVSKVRLRQVLILFT